MTEPRDAELDALEKAEILLRFAAENSKDLPKSVIHAICAAWTAKDTSKWTPEIAQDFWKAFHFLCNAIKPANLDTLIWTNRQVRYRSFAPMWKRADDTISFPQRTSRRYMIMLLGLLFISVFLQFIVSTANDLKVDVEKLLVSSEPIVLDVSQKLPLLQAAGVNDFNDPKLSEDIKAVIARSRSQMAGVYSNFDRITFKTETFSALTYLQVGDQPLHINAIFVDPNLKELQNGTNAYFRLRQRVVLRLQKGSVVLGIISISVLPILLGTMGSCAYVTRLIAQQIRETTFSSTSPIRNLVRIALGSLAGVVVGYGGIATNLSVSPSALAFMAGYSIEPVFATLDNLAERFRKPIEVART